MRRTLQTGLALLVAVAFTGAVAVCLAVLVAPWLGPAADDPVAVGLIAVGIAFAFAAVQFRYVRRETLAEVDATVVDPVDYPDVSARLTRLAAAANVPVPALAVVDRDVANSCSVADPTGGTVVVSTGLVAELDGEALDAVLAHELAHLGTRDSQVLTFVSFLPALVAGGYSPVADAGIDRLPVATQWLLGGCVVAAGYLLALPSLPGGAGSVASLTAYAVGLFAVVVVGGVAVGVAATLATVVSRRLARQRELAADRAAARITGSPARLAAVLERLTDRERADRDARVVAGRDPAHVTGVCLLPHGFGEPDDEPEADDTAGPFADFEIETRAHPPLERRVAALRELVDRQETGTGAYAG